jgi:hypothetical protein
MFAVLTRVPPLTVELPVAIVVTLPGAGVPRVIVKTELPVPPAERGTEVGLNANPKPTAG